MDALKILHEYKNNGDRVDEALFHIVENEINRLREALECIGDGGYEFLEILKVAHQALGLEEENI